MVAGVWGGGWRVGVFAAVHGSDLPVLAVSPDYGTPQMIFIQFIQCGTRISDLVVKETGSKGVDKL